MRSASETARGREPLSARARVSAALNIAFALLAIGSWLTMFLRAGGNGQRFIEYEISGDALDLSNWKKTGNEWQDG